MSKTKQRILSVVLTIILMLANVGVEDSVIIGYNNVAGVCAFSLGRIENCYNTGDVRALAQCAGGISGNDISGQAEGISTKELCNILSLNNFDSSV